MRISDWSSDVCSSDLTEDDFFGDTATHGHGQVRIHLVSMVAVAIPLRQSHNHAQSAATWNDRRLVNGIGCRFMDRNDGVTGFVISRHLLLVRSEEHTSELQSQMRISYAVFCLKKKKNNYNHTYNKNITTNTI